MNHSLQIGELAKRTGCLVETIRYYERKDYCLTPSGPKEITGSFQTFTSNAFDSSGTAVRWT